MLKKDLVLAFGLSGGCLNNKQIFFDGSKLAKTRNSLFDGFNIYCSGVLFATGLGSVLVIDKDRKYLGTIMPCKKLLNVVLILKKNIFTLLAQMFWK